MLLKELAERLYPALLANFKSSEPCRLFLSAAPKNTQAVVRHAICDTPEEAWTTALTFLEEVFAEGKQPSILRADWVTSTEIVTWQDFLNKAADTPNGYFCQGVALDKEYKLAFLEQELNANFILCNPTQKNVKNHFRFKHAENYCQQRFNCEFPKLDATAEVILFKTSGVFIQESMSKPLRMIDGRREIDKDDSELFIRMAKRTARYLIQQRKESELFIYGIFPRADRLIDDYDLHGHFGTLFAMSEVCAVYKDDNSKKNLGAAIERGLEYAVKNYSCPQKTLDGEDICYFKDGNSIKLGTSGLALLALSKWTTFSGNAKYVPLMQAVARGIFSLQRPDGTFTHVLNAKDFSVQKEFDNPAYDGKAVYGMLRLYAMTNDEKILASCERAINRFIALNYWKYCDSWLTYAVNEFTVYRPEEKYFAFALNNIPNAFDNGSIRLEQILVTMKLIQRMKSLPEMKTLLERVDEASLSSTIKACVAQAVSTYFGAEVSMYFENPKLIFNGSFIHSDFFGASAEDVQRTMSSFLAYAAYLNGKSIEVKTQPVKFITTDILPKLQVGIMRQNKNNVWKPLHTLCAMFYTAKQFDIDLFLFSTEDVNFEDRTINATILVGNDKIKKRVPFPRIIENSFVKGEEGKIVRRLGKEGCYLVRRPLRTTKQEVYDMLLKDGRFKEFLIETHIVESFEHFLALAKKYYGDVILKPLGGNRGIGVARLTFNGEQCAINMKNSTVILKTQEELKTFYDRFFTKVVHILQPYITSRTRAGNPFDIRIHVRRGAGGKFKVSPFPRIGNAEGVVSNISSGGFSMKFENFLQLEFGADWEMIYKRLMDFGNTFPDYYQSFYPVTIFDIGVDVGIQKRGDTYLFKIFEVNTQIDGPYFEIEDAITHFEYFRYLAQKLREGSLK